MVAQAQATYTYLVKLESQHALSGNSSKGIFGGWSIRTPTMQYTAKLESSPLRFDSPTAARARFPRDKHPSQYPRRSPVIYDRITQDAIPIVAAAAAAAATQEFMRAHMAVDEEEADAVD